MPRYIDADAMKKDLEENYVFVGFADLLNDIVEAIDAQPTADVIERKRGRWENICSLQNWQYTYEHYRCSNCGIPAECAFRHCPNCGAEMEQ